MCSHCTFIRYQPTIIDHKDGIVYKKSIKRWAVHAISERCLQNPTPNEIDTFLSNIIVWCKLVDDIPWNLILLSHTRGEHMHAWITIDELNRSATHAFQMKYDTDSNGYFNQIKSQNPNLPNLLRSTISKRPYATDIHIDTIKSKLLPTLQHYMSNKHIFIYDPQTSSDPRITIGIPP